MPVKKTEEVKVSEQEVQEVQEIPDTPDTPEKQAYRALVEKYKAKNPVKYAQKKAEIERKLKADVGVRKDKQGRILGYTFANMPPKE